MSRVIIEKVMPTGWHYMQGRFRINAEGHEELIQNVIEWRVQNGTPVGDVESDVESYICSHFPDQCHPEFRGIKKTIMQIPPKANNRFIDKLTQWGLSIKNLKESQDLVTDAEANRRGESCINCIHNVSWENQCKPCVANGLRLFTLIRKNRDSAHWRKLSACNLFNHCNRTAIFLNKDLIPMNDAAPDHCWIRKEKI